MSRHRTAASWLVVATVTGLLTAGCNAAPPGGRHRASAAGSAARVTITPADGSTDVAPRAGITVFATGGTIRQVQVRSAGTPVVGTFSDGRRRWRSAWTLGVARRYTVTAVAVDPAGRTVTATSSFHTLTPDRTFHTRIFEGYQQTYGVGMPIILTFDAPIHDKAAVEHALQIRTSKPVVGAWYWDGDQRVDFRPRTYWPVGTVVHFTGHLDGVQGAPGMYGDHTLTQTFRIGRSLIVVADTATHHMRVYENGRLRYTWPISTGRPGDDTPNGTYLTIEKGNPVDMIGPGYNIEVPYSVRITFSGDYLHDAYWSVTDQGFTNVSHGCVNMPPADAQIYYRLAVPGDPVTITGSPMAGTWDNGWTDWFLSWRHLLAGSASHLAVRAGPGGSTFVDPAALPTPTRSAPLHAAAPGNATATRSR